ncbi:hypothetical protein [Luteibacter sp. dw_328]|uniref:hypothetical protein n=1 Tax=Luteibacter sp. dw_328 TaxID=2719796 RepID=UPI001BD57350|nr:hypothetical protein [Luteibacter sp. dw_328]
MHKLFSFGLKGRTAEVIRRAAQALLLGGFVDKTTIDESDLNDEAKAGLYLYAAANCLYDLYLQMKMSTSGNEKWATINFFMENAIEGIDAYEKSFSMPPGMIARHLVPVLAKIGGYATESGAYPDLMSAKEVEKLDMEVDVEEARKLIVEAQEKFRAATAPMFL